MGSRVEISPDQDLEQDVEESRVVFQSFLEQHHSKEIEEILLKADATDNYALAVNALEVFDTNMHVGQLILSQPEKFLPLFDDALGKVEVNIMQSHPSQNDMSFKPFLRVRFSNLPICPELTRVTLPKSTDIGKFLAVSGKMLSRDE